MAKRTRKGNLADKLGTEGRKAVSNHRADETTFDTGGNLPSGIEGGIAQLVDCKFDTHKKGDNEGEYYFYAAGIVVQPKEHDGIPIEGQRTSIMEPIYDTPNRSRASLDEHIDWVMNELRKLGVDTSELDEHTLEDAAAALKEEQPFFRFRTWKGEKQTTGPYAGREPFLNEVWKGACEYEGDEEGGDVVDNTRGGEKEEAQTEEGFEDLADLSKAADEDDEAAQTVLSKKAQEVDIDPDDYDTWTEVAEAIEGAPEDEEEEEEEEEDDTPSSFEPEKEEVYLYKPPRARKAIECEVMAVFPRKRTCNLKSLDDGKSFKNVPWEKLEKDE
jgi:hypothetical protein